MDAENGGVDSEFLLPEQKVYHLYNPPIINYNDVRGNWISMVWSNLIVGSHALHNVAKDFVNVENAIATFFWPTPPTSIIINDTILIQYIIKQGLKAFEKKLRLQYKNNCISFVTVELSSQRSLKTSYMNNKERDWYT